MTEREWTELYRRCLPSLYRAVSRRVGGERALAEDVTQEPWLRAVRAWRAGGLPRDPDAWLVTTASHLIRNVFRRRSLEGPSLGDALESLEAPDVDAEVSERAIEAERVRSIQLALARLKPEQAELLCSRHFDSLPLDEIARVRGLSVRAVEGRLHRARAALSKHLDPELLNHI